MSSPIMLKGLFDTPINNPATAGDLVRTRAIQALDSGYQPSGEGGFADCPPGFLPNTYGGCDPDPNNPPTGGDSGTGFLDGGGDGSGSGGFSVDSNTPVNVSVNNAINITDTGIQQISDQITQALLNTDKETQSLIDQLNKSIVSNIQEESDSIQSSINNASTNLGNEVTITTTALATSTAATQAAVAKSITDEIHNVTGAITPILSTIQGFIDKISADVQAINDNFLTPLLTLYNSTVGTIATLTQAIEQDLHDGISGLLKIPGQLADQLASFDAVLDRTVQQLGTQNLETVKSGIDYEAGVLPKPFGDAMAASLGGKVSADSLLTTFNTNVPLASESLQQVSNEAIAGLGGLLKQLLHSVTTTFNDSIAQLHTGWKGVDSVFISLLDGLLGLLTTVTAMGTLATPLISAAEQEAQSLAPTRKLDPGTVVVAMRRGFLDAATGLKEMSYAGLDSTRQQVLQDLQVYLADVNTAIDWWYRGIIGDTDLEENLLANGLTATDGAAIKAGSIRLPQITELIRWMNFGIITQDQFISNCKILRYDDAQIQAILSTYQDHETPQTLSNLSGLLNNSNASFVNNTLKIPVPDDVALAGARANYHPDLVRYVWLAHWNIPSVQSFILAYFRGVRTLTELQQRFAMDNIPQELWDDLIQVNRPLIPYRSIPSFVKAGYMTDTQAQDELAQHGFDLAHQQIILKAFTPKSTTTQTAAAQQVHVLSQANAKALWEDGVFTDEQYIQTLEAHGYTADLAAAQLQADKINQHIKQQKQTLADLSAEVQTGAITLDDASGQLQDQGFTAAQIATFQAKNGKLLKSNIKHPSIADMQKFIKAGLITIDEFEQELVAQGWQDPWLTAWVTFEGGNVPGASKQQPTT